MHPEGCAPSPWHFPGSCLAGHLVYMPSTQLALLRTLAGQAMTGFPAISIPFSQPLKMGHSTKSCGGEGRRMWRTPLGWVHTQTCIPMLRKSAWIQPESYCRQQLRAEITQPASGRRSNGGATFHRVGRYYGCAETKHSTNAGKDYNTFNKELKRWFLPWASIIIFPLHEIRKDFRI